jgi:DNA adenine methylase
MDSLPKQIVPFVKWAGGKSQLLSELGRYFPSSFKRYFEPFLGGGAVYFHLKRNSAVLSDANFELINTYRIVAQKVDDLVHELDWYQSQILTQELYYRVRGQDTDDLNDVERAARFIFLNKTCYNGLYRVNSDGEFNVPIGSYEKMPRLYELSNLKAASSLLKSAKIRAGYYLPVLSEFHAGEGDFVYMDPPYASEESNGFTSYTKETFSWTEQQKLAREFATLAEKGCHVMVSNANVEHVRELYRDVAKVIIQVKADRMINSNGNQRTGYSELIILSYVPEDRSLVPWTKMTD